jgi:hypothetical protein
MSQIHLSSPAAFVDARIFTQPLFVIQEPVIGQSAYTVKFQSPQFPVKGLYFVRTKLNTHVIDFKPVSSDLLTVFPNSGNNVEAYQRFVLSTISGQIALSDLLRDKYNSVPSHLVGFPPQMFEEDYDILLDFLPDVNDGVITCFVACHSTRDVYIDLTGNIGEGVSSVPVTYSHKS